MFAVCACSRFQVTPKLSHLHDVKRIFSDYAGAYLDGESTTGGCQFLGRRFISWQCKKQTIVATSTTEAKYVATANYCKKLVLPGKVSAAELPLEKVLLGIHATVDGKTIVITDSPVRRDLLFTNDNGITCLTNAQILENLSLMGYEGALSNLTF
nr:hypothetical protein [Tanacetum cinerariifolium]